MRLSRPLSVPPIDLSTVDLLDHSLFSEGDPHAIWAQMRREDPVHWQSGSDGPGFWSVTRYAEGELVLRDHTRFTSQRGTMLFLLGRDDPARGRQMAATDPPQHSRMREPVQRALTNKAVERYRPAIQQEIRRVLAPALDGGPFDFAAAMMMLPMAAAGTMMALPRGDWPRLTDLTSMSIAPEDPEFTMGTGKGTLELAHRELFAYFHDIIKVRRDNLGDDLISMLLSIDLDGRRPETGAILSNCYSLILGANVTTPYVPTGAMIEFTTTPVLTDWRANKARVHKTAIDEALRWASPANHFMRYALEDVELGGHRIAQGEAVVVWLGACNRDEAVFDRPYDFNIRRKPNRHITFGAGSHYCVGHTVARLTMQILFEELIDNFGGFEITGDVQHLRSNFVAGIKHMPLIAEISSHARPLYEEAAESVQVPAMQGGSR
jgi:cytochrome P450